MFIMYGLIFGKFAPLHNGHVNFIKESAKHCDTLVVVVSYDDKFNVKQTDFWKKYLTLENRLEWLNKEFKDYDDIIITYVDESELKGYPNSWQEYANLVYDAFYNATGVNSPNMVFSSEWEYDDGIKTYFPESVHVVIDSTRKAVTISATQIREHLYVHWEYLPRSVQFTLAKKIALIGIESTGKTTLSERLAKHYVAPVVPEFAKEFIINELNGVEKNIDDNHYDMFATKQLESIWELYDGSELAFIDTNAFITGFYQRLYTGKISPVVEDLMRTESYDLILYLDNDVEWIDDGMRYHGTPTLRQKAKVLFELMLLEYNINYVKINGSYDERFKSAIKHINGVLR